MQHDDLQKKLKLTPFKPFRIFLTDGANYEVRHPELLLVGKRMCVVGVAKDPNQTYFDESVDIDLLHVVRAEFVYDPVPHGPDNSNGALGK